MGRVEGTEGSRGGRGVADQRCEVKGCRDIVGPGGADP